MAIRRFLIPEGHPSKRISVEVPELPAAVRSVLATELPSNVREVLSELWQRVEQAGLPVKAAKALVLGLWALAEFYNAKEMREERLKIGRLRRRAKSIRVPEEHLRTVEEAQTSGLQRFSSLLVYAYVAECGADHIRIRDWRPLFEILAVIWSIRIGDPQTRILRRLRERYRRTKSLPRIRDVAGACMRQVHAALHESANP